MNEQGENVKAAKAIHSIRIKGYAAIGLGLFLLYLCIYRPISAAMNGKEATLFLKATVLIPPAILGGLFAAIAPRTLYALNPASNKKAADRLAISAVALVFIGIGLYYLINRYLLMHGYSP